MYKKITAAVIILGSVLILLFGCTGRSAPDTYAGTERISTMEGYNSGYDPAHLSSAEAWDLVNSDSGATVLDVRSEDSYQERHVSIALNVPYEQIAEYAAENIPGKDSVIICYCFCGDKGGPALSACKLLNELGYANAYYMEPDAEWTYEGTSVNKTTEEKSMHKIISGQEAKDMYNSDSAVILLDVRNQDEYNAGHIEGSVLIPVSELESRLSELPDKDAAIIVYCRSGMRSAAAYNTLSANGYTNIYDMQSVSNWPQG